MLVEARTGISRVSKIVRALKTFSRIEEERSDVIDLIPVVELSINMAYNEIRHCARVVKDYGPLPLVEADDARSGQVFINLLVNAAQAFPEGNTQRNEIRVVTSTDAAGRALVEVRDNGPGIAPGGSDPYLRSVLYDQDAGRRDRIGARHQPQHRDRNGRHDRRAE